MVDPRILEEFSRRNVLVTGGTGLIGRQVVGILCDAGAKVRVVSLDRFTLDPRAEYAVGDLCSFDTCREMANDMEFVFHLAGIQGTAQTSGSRMASHFVPTLMMNVNVLEASRLAGARKVVYTSSIGAYADNEVLRESEARPDSHPMSFAGWAKRMGELQVHAYKVQYGLENYSVVRLAQVYGPGDNFDAETGMVIPSLMARIADGENPLVVWGDGSAVRDFLYSRDAAEGIILALHHGTGGGFVNLASGQGTSIRDLVLTLRGFLDFDYRFDPGKPAGAPRRVMDISLARERLGFHPTTGLGKGLEKTWDWFRAHADEHRAKKNYFVDP